MPPNQSSSSPANYEPFKVRKLAYFSTALLVHIADFPLYYIERLSPIHFIVAGGGGRAGTGVHNKICILELVPNWDSCSTKLVTDYKIPKDDAVMTGSLRKDLTPINTALVTGGSNPNIFDIVYSPDMKNFYVKNYAPLDDFRQTNPECEVKCVKCSKDYILTGDTDGYLSSWSLVEGQPVFHKKVKAHSGEIDEIDVTNGRILTISRKENKCIQWDLKKLQNIGQLNRDFINTPQAKFTFRSARYIQVANKPLILLLVCNPITKNESAKLIKVKADDGKVLSTKRLTPDGIMATAISPCGKLLALGTREGSVSILKTDNLSQTYFIRAAHDNTVTALEFLEPAAETLLLTNSKSCPLVSVSIDRRVILHRPNNISVISTISKWFLLGVAMPMTISFLYENLTDMMKII